MGRVTLQTIADQVGVSRMTVSNAFSRPDQLSAGMRDRILAAAKELGYAGPDPAARALARGATGAVGVLLTHSLPYAFRDEVATGFLGAIAEELGPTGLAITLLTASDEDDTIPARDVPMDGAVVYSCDPESTAIDWLQRRGLPVVYVDQDPARSVASVNVDDRSGARAAAQHLVDLGHRRVGILTPTTDFHAQRERVLGWTDALSAAGVEPQVVGRPLLDADGAYDEARRLLDREDRPTAVLCFSDVLAGSVVQAAHDLDLRVPEDLSVVGFDDSPFARRMRPALTTVRQDVQAKGRAAAAALTQALERARTGAAGRVRHVVLPTELVVRDSTAPPRG